jgi:ribosomal protein S18 acetylase RimI-like enzyme
MTVAPFTMGDCGPFLRLAKEENWLAESWEVEFLLSRFPGGCFTFRNADGQACGFVTSLKHDRSGWIGNLIVAPEQRQQGVGEQLFTSALAALRDGGAETVWLTASQAGQPLYEKHGFTVIDTINRRAGPGRERPERAESPAGSNLPAALVGDIDRLTWGDRRTALLEATIRRGNLLTAESGFLVIQPCLTARQFGPFAATDPGTAEQLLQHALGSISPNSAVYLDTPAANPAAGTLCHTRGLQIIGSSLLMYAGTKPDYRPEFLYSLATMGSCG